MTPHVLMPAKACHMYRPSPTDVSAFIVDLMHFPAEQEAPAHARLASNEASYVTVRICGALGEEWVRGGSRAE